MLTKEEEETAEMRYAIHSGEAIMTRKQMEAYEVGNAIRNLLDEIETEGVEISEQELEQRINELCKAFGVTPPSLKPKKHKPHTCSQCGAPIHNGKCDYCGTIYN